MLYDSSLNSMNVCHLFDRSFCASLHRWCVDSLHVTVRGMREGWRTYGSVNYRLLYKLVLYTVDSLST